MARDLTTAFEAATKAKEVAPILMVEMAFVSGTVRLWTGYGDITSGGHTWTGAGTLGSISEPEEVLDPAAKGITLTLTAVPNEYAALALSEEYQGRNAKVFLGVLNSDGTLIADPYQLFGGRMDVMTIQDGGTTSSISVSVENRLIDLTRSRERRYSHQDQQIEYPGDLGFEYVNSLQDKEIRWGIPLPSIAQNTAPTINNNGFRPHR